MASGAVVTAHRLRQVPCLRVLQAHLAAEYLPYPAHQQHQAHLIIRLLQQGPVLTHL